MAGQARPWSWLAEREAVEQVPTGQVRALAHAPSRSSARSLRAQLRGSSLQVPVQPWAAQRVQVAP